MAKVTSRDNQPSFNGPMQDPFYVVKEEVLQSIQGITALYERWKDLLNNTNTASNEEFKWTTNELKTGLKTIEYDVTDLEETVSVVETNKAKFKIEEPEIMTRKAFIQSTKQKIQVIKDDMQSTKTKSKMDRDQREILMPKKSSSDRQAKLQSALEQDNQAFVEGQQTRQLQIVKEQDQHLDVLNRTVGTLREMGSQMDRTIKEHEVIIEDLDKEATRTDSRLKGAIKKVNELIDSTKDSTQWCIIIVLILVLVGLLVLVFYIPKKQ